jgi:hypothetical protein
MKKNTTIISVLSGEENTAHAYVLCKGRARTQDPDILALASVLLVITPAAHIDPAPTLYGSDLHTLQKRDNFECYEIGIKLESGIPQIL